MANYNAPMGMTPVSHINGGDWNGKTNRYFIAASDMNAFYIGDVVVSAPGAGDGMVNGQIVVGVPQVTKAGVGAAARGVIVSVEQDQNGNGQRYVPATKTRGYFVNVADDPLLIFQIQVSNSSLLTATCVGEFGDLLVAASASGQGVSGTRLDSTTIGTTTGPLRILGLALGDFTANAQVLVCFVWHELAGQSSPIILSSAAPVNADGRPDGTIYIQTV